MAHPFDGGAARNPRGAASVVDYLEGQSGGYLAGVSGTASVPAGHRLVALTVQAGSGSAGSVVVAGGQPIPLPAGTSLEWAPRTIFEAPTIIFDSTVTYIVEYAAL